MLLLLLANFSNNSYCFKSMIFGSIGDHCIFLFVCLFVDINK